MNPTDWTMQRLEPLATQLVATLLPEMLTFAAAMVGIAALAALLLDGIGPTLRGRGRGRSPNETPAPARRNHQARRPGVRLSAAPPGSG